MSNTSAMLWTKIHVVIGHETFLPKASGSVITEMGCEQTEND